MKPQTGDIVYHMCPWGLQPGTVEEVDGVRALIKWDDPYYEYSQNFDLYLEGWIDFQEAYPWQGGWMI